MIRTLRNYSVNNFPMYHAVMLAIVIMLSTISPALSYTWKSGNFRPTSSNSSPPYSASGIHKSDLFSMSLFVFRFHISVRSYSTYLSFSVQLILLSTVPSRSIHIVKNGRISSFFSYLNNIPLCISLTILSVHPSMDT